MNDIGIRTIPADTRCYLWDMKAETMSKEYFVLQGDLQVLVREGYGPLYGALKEMVYSSNGTQISGPTVREFARQIPLFGSMVSHDSSMDQAIRILADRFPDAHAMLMAIGANNRIALFFLDEGNAPDIESLL